ncbi:MAG TPA: hypothetical protein VK787_15890 [Puia sp.]|nr:hypothetical protein [Puia sp.]
MKKSFLFYVIVLLLFSFSNCKKDNGPKSDNPYGLPNATRSGLGTFACRINGIDFIAKYGAYNGLPNGKYSSDSTTLGASFGSNYFLFFDVHVKENVQLNLAYEMYNNSNLSFVYLSDSSCFGISSNVINAFTAIGSIKFSRLDSVNKIISGTFSFQVPIPACDTLNFTDGRFDIHY